MELRPLSDFILVTVPDPILRRTVPLYDFYRSEDDIQLVYDEMVRIAEASPVPLAGLAANQIGDGETRLFILNTNVEGEWRPFVNPTIVQRGNRTWWGIEGCGSLPNIAVNVKRCFQITVNYQDLDGHEHTENFDEWPARVIQHEIDHLNGVLITDYNDQLENLPSTDTN